MKFKIEWIVILGLLILIAVQQCSKPEPVSIDPDREMQYKRQAAIDKIEKDSIQALQTKQNKEAAERTKKDSATIARQAIENRAIRRERDKAQVTIQHLIDTIPSLRLYVELSDSLFQHQQKEIDTLKSALDFQVKINQELIGLEYQEDKIEAQMLIDCERNREEISKDYRKLLRKERRKKKFNAVLVPIVAAGAFLFGSQL